MLLAALVAGLVLGSATYALAAHEHTASLWGHGQGTGDQPTWVNPNVHPYLASSDGTARNSCVGWGKANTSYHSGEQCDIATHNHMNFTTTLDKCIYYSHNRSGQTSLSDHHNHRCH